MKGFWKFLVVIVIISTALSLLFTLGFASIAKAKFSDTFLIVLMCS